MKFRNPKTGEVFDSIEDAVEKFRCPGPCADCRLGIDVGGVHGCFIGHWWSEHPAEAARLMGYEVIEDNCLESDAIDCTTCAYAGRPSYKSPCSECNDYNKFEEVNMEKKDKPRLAEVLGVEVGERFSIDGFASLGELHINGNGYLSNDNWENAPAVALAHIINHPESIIRAPRLTEAEMERCRVMGAKWVSRDLKVGLERVDLWDVKPEKKELGYFMARTVPPLAIVACKLFPSVGLGDCICVEEADGDEH